VLPHWGHLFRCGACQRFAALRVRNRILDVLRFGTPMGARYQSTHFLKNKSGTGDSLKVKMLKRMTLQLF
jgi:hypothetical protein